MILKQFYLGCLAHASYLVGDEQTGDVAVVDPQRDIDQYVTFAADHNLQIKHVFLTHLHADFIAGHLELRDRVGAKIYLGASAKAKYAFTALKDGEGIEFGKVRLEVLETPGHTPESISILVYDLAVSDTQPNAVLTGDTLFIGDVGRPDLRAALGWSAAQLGGMLYDSLHNKLLPLPDASLVYPAHGAGSLCGKSISKETVSTIGEQRRVNYALQPMTKDAFIQVVTADQPEAPDYFTYDAVLNSEERPTLDQALEQGLNPLPLDTVLGLQSANAQILDTRDPAEFAAAHLKGSINIGLGGQYATWAGTVLNREDPIVIIAVPGREKESAVRLGRIGFDHIVGFLNDGLRSLDSRPDLVTTTESFSPQYALERMAGSNSRIEPSTNSVVGAGLAPPDHRVLANPNSGGDTFNSLADASAPLVIDVRNPGERTRKFIDGSQSIPLNHLVEKADHLPRDREILVYCAGGYRSSIAASLLQRAAFTHVAEIAGGLAAWDSAHLPLRTS
jgi:glyoxylase-like metal-dependent hydrolase (beta-lactamase superfamily II)/rhodanese-related sulfurtransferase